MQRVVASIFLLFLLGAAVHPAWPQEDPDAAGPEARQDDLDQLQWCVEGVVDPNLKPEERSRWAKRLLGLPEARGWVVELLGLFENPGAQQAVCEALANGGHEHPELLVADYVDPLISLLGAEIEPLRRAAVEALAVFPGPDVPTCLGELAASADTSLIKRLAAIDALAVNTHRREVVGQLVGLLDTGVPEIVDRVLTVLQAASREPFELDPDRCRAWWAEKSQLSEAAWLSDQLRTYRDRLRARDAELEVHRDAAAQRNAAISERLGEFQSELFRVLGPEQQDARLAEWLNDPLVQVQLTALAKIKARIADEGKRPQGAVLEGLLRLFKQGTPAVRREVLLIAQNLGDPVVVEAILAQLAVERDPATRHAIFKALGRFQSPQAIPALIEEIASDKSRPECVKEAATALGLVAGRTPDAQLLKDAVPALKNRYALVPADQVELRAALLQAMAGVADESFAPEFRTAVESDDASLLKPAIQGLRAIGDMSAFPRLRTLTAHTDSGVRLAAIQAVGHFGREDADLETLLSRLNPAIEASEPARDAAWRAFGDFLSRKPVADRIKSAQRLRDLGDLEIRYLQRLAGELAAVNGNAASLENVCDRLASTLIARGQYAEAIPHLEELYATQLARGDPMAPESGLRLLEATLRSGTYQGAPDLLKRLADAAKDAAAKDKIVTTVAQYAHSPELVADAQRTTALRDALQQVPAGVFSDSWTQLLRELTAQRETAESETATDP